MTNQKIRGLHEGSIRVAQSGAVYDIDARAIVIGSSQSSSGVRVAAIYEDNATALVQNNTYTIDGRLVGFRAGIETVGDGDVITIGTTGEVEGATAISTTGMGTIVTNRGHVTSGDGVGVFQNGAQSVIRNLGTIAGFVGVWTESSSQQQVINLKKGYIEGINEGVELAGTGATMINHGRVHGDLWSVYAGGDQAVIINDGTLDGDVNLGNGSNVLDTTGGIVHGAIIGGTGNDHLITDNARSKLVEEANGGADTVYSSVSYRLSDNVESLVLTGNKNINGTGTAGDDILIGNDGDNKLIGGDGFDTLVGGKGDDVLVGTVDTGDIDTFVFRSGDGHDTIVNYVESSDLINVANWRGIDNLVDIALHAHETDSGLLIALGHDSLLLAGFTKSDLSDRGLQFTF